MDQNNKLNHKILMNPKIFIVTLDKKKSDSITSRLTQLNDSIKIGKMFSTDILLSDKEHHYMSIDDMFLCYKNNDILCVKTNKDDISVGYTMEEYDHSDVICVDYELYNIISQRKIHEDLVVWVDSSKIHLDKRNIRKAKEFMELTKSRHVLYFNTEEPDDLIIINMMNWISGTWSQRKEIENNCK